MAITYPTTLDTLSNPSSTDTLDSPSHSDQHSDANDAIEALEAKVGADSSAVSSSHDYKIDALETSVSTLESAQPTGDVVGTSDTQTLTNKTLSTGSTIDANVTVTEVLKKAYPVGSIYINATSSTNPATLLGFGTWSAFGAGRVMVGIDSEDADFDTAEETGGAKTVTLTTAQMPEHTHTQNSHNHTQNSHDHGMAAHNHSQDSHGHRMQYIGVAGGGSTYQIPDSSSGNYKNKNTWVENTTATNNSATSNSYALTATNQSTTATNQDTGGDEAHSNVQPYIVAYFWKRTA